MSLWEWLFACDGWKLANGSGEGETSVSAPREEDFLAMFGDDPGKAN